MQRSEVIARLTERAGHLQDAGILALYLFGSVARDEAGLDSDVDLFVDPQYERFGFVELIRTETYLAQALGCRVDLTTREGLHPHLRAEIEREAIRVL